VQEHFEVIVIGIIVVSLTPTIVHAVQSSLAKRKREPERAA
jgi:hypothetical protein